MLVASEDAELACLGNNPGRCSGIAKVCCGRATTARRNAAPKGMIYVSVASRVVSGGK
jgi:hypothetical protein